MKHPFAFISMLILLSWPSACFPQQLHAELTLIIPAGTYDLKTMPMSSLGRMGAFAAMGNRITALEDEGGEFDIRAFTLPDTIDIEAFYFLTEKMVMKHKNHVLWVTFNGLFDGMEFENDAFHIANATDSTFLLIRSEAQDIWEFSMDRKNIRRNYRFAEPPLTAGMVDSSMIAITTEKLYLVTPDKSVILHHHPISIKCAAVTPIGIFFGTDDALWRLVGVEEIEHIASGSISRMFGSGRMLYVVDNADNLYKFVFSETGQEDSHD